VTPFHKKKSQSSWMSKTKVAQKGKKKEKKCWDRPGGENGQPTYEQNLCVAERPGSAAWRGKKEGVGKKQGLRK